MKVDKKNKYMDNGNHYRKTDLQVHSPRDIGWSGGEFVTDEERAEFATNFIKDCREAGLDAIAITDHHDLVFFEYIKKAAISELDEHGHPVSEKSRIVVFPGVEVTLSTPPIQGLLILDANFPQDLFPTVLGCLSIKQANKSASRTADVVPIPTTNISGINDIYDKLDGTDGVKGRYIFLPHVSCKGHKTLMRKGFHESYATMQCCGGYVDGKFDGSDVGYMKVISGEVDAYGFKSIAVIQTTDHRGPKKIGEAGIATWIKWKEPTAEALRQACLAQTSRISLVEPDVPNIFIERIDVTNSAFLSKFSLNFNAQLNSIIGGRGTGKSSILEYLRWALCDQTDGFGNEELVSEIERKRSTLIQKTLNDINGEVRVTFSVNGTRHVVKRNPKQEDVLLKIGDGEFESVRPSFIRNLLPIQAYSQKQLSSVSISSGELKRFIEQPISNELESIDSQLSTLQKKVRDSYDDLLKNKSLVFEIAKLELEKSSLKKQIEELQKSLKGITPDDRAIIERAKLYVNENGRIKEVVLEYQEVSAALSILERAVSSYNDLEKGDLETENTSIIDALEKERAEYLGGLVNNIARLQSEHLNSEDKITKIQGDWDIKRNEFKAIYTGVKEKSTSSKQTLESIKELERKLEKLDLSINERKTILHKTNIDDDAYAGIYQQYIDAQQSRLDMMKSSIEGFTALSDGYIRADYENSINAEELAREIKNVFSGRSLGIQTAKIDRLASLVADSNTPISTWCDIVKEIKLLSEFNLSLSSQDKLPATPILNEATLTEANNRKISEFLVEDSFTAFASIRLEFLPLFMYRTNNEMEDEVSFEDASAGQQATALINVLLNQEGAPLIIDQPEDDIDNRAIDKLIEKLWDSKKRRQIIFTSHNANIVVNGDSELVVCCDYNDSSQKTMGSIKYEGSIDEKMIRDEITLIMEGGERAFKLRKEKYGF